MIALDQTMIAARLPEAPLSLPVVQPLSVGVCMHVSVESRGLTRFIGSLPQDYPARTLFY
jgi:hypothetical protein